MEIDWLVGQWVRCHAHITRMFDVLWTIWVKFLQSLGFDPRGLFRYYDGRWIRRADPMVIARRLWSVDVPQEIASGEFIPKPFESIDSLNRITSGVGVQIQQGYAEIDYAVRYAFQLRPLSQGGLSENECQKLLERFEDYLGDVKKNGSKTRISSSGTVVPDVTVMNSDSDGGSTGTESAMPMPDVSEREAQLRTTL